MKRKLPAIIPIITFIFFSLLYSKKKSELPPEYKKWIEEEVVYIITPKEREVFYQLETDAQRDRFIEEFWRQRDPTPGTPRNEFKEEHYRRIEYANKWFGKGTPIPGWKTDRGRVYIILGEPIYRQSFTGQEIFPIELWFYHGDVSKGFPPFYYILFFKREGSGDYVLYSPLKDGPNKLCPATSHESWDPYRPRTSRERRESFFGGGALKDQQIGGPAYAILARVSYVLAQASLSLIPGGTVNNPIESEKLLGNINTFPQKKSR